MTPKKHVERLVHLLRKGIPRAEVAVDAPSRVSGHWFVDVRAGKHTFAVEFRPTLGFGLSSSPSDGLGEGPDEFVENEEGVVRRIRALLRSKTGTVPQRVRLLQELREKRHISQIELADKLGVRQPTVSKIERREDVNLGTLRRYIRALGGELHILAEFKDESVEIGVTKPKKAAGR
jgi:DNA-binding XRE family transcriptional regulator